MSYQQDVFSLIARFSGQENMLSVPRAFCEATGSLEAGMLLSQLLYWSDKGHDPEGWFYKSYIEWSEHLFLTEYQVRKFSKQFEEAGFLEVKLKKVNGSPTLHYRIKRGEFSEWILKNLGIETAKFPNPNRKISESNNKETETTTETTNIESDQGVSRAIAAPPTPTPPATPKAPLLPNDGYEIPNPPTNGHTKKYARVTSDYYDPRRLVDGYIPAGQGTTAIEVYHEWVAPSARRLSQPNQTDILQQVTDLERWRTAVKAWVQAGHRAEDVGGMLDWYHDPSRLPSAKFAKPANGAVKTQEVTFKQWMLNTYHSTFASTIKPESELRDEYRQWRKANGLPPAG